MTSVQVSYVPGSLTALASTRTWLLLDVPVGHPVVDQCWHDLAAGAGTSEVLDLLVRTFGVLDLPGFAMLGDGPGAAVQAAVRQPLTLVVDGERVEGPAGSPWTVREVSAANVVLGTESGDALPLGTGVTMAVSLSVSFVGVDPSGGPEPTAPEAQVLPVSVEVEPEPEPEAPVTEEVRPPPTASEPTASAGDAEEAPVEGGSQPDEYDAWLRPEAHHPDAASADVSPPAVDQAHLTRSWEPSEPPEELPVPDDLSPERGEREDQVRSPARPAPGLIDGVPWATDVPAVVAPDSGPPPVSVAEPPTEPSEPSASVVEETIPRSSIAATPVGPTVLAAWCPDGHPTPANAATCRVCGVEVPPQPATEIVRPALGRLHLSTGESVVLDRGVVMGREPRIPEDSTERPHRVTLGAGGRDVSRQHLEILIDGWNVHVRDLGSTNGTFIGDSRTPLAPGQTELLVPGATLNVAGVFTVRFDPHA